MRSARALVVGAALALVLPATARAQDDAVPAINPVIAANVADPSVVRAGGRYWAAATSGQWAPVFPLFTSRDLVHWRQTGAVFPRPPRWAKGRFWAPGLAVHRGTWSVYYSASRLPRRPCIAVAQARSPYGPWRDRGFVICPPSGAIDAAAITAPTGERFLLWKRMGYGHGIYGARLADDGRTIVSTPRRLIVPDTRWERGVNEGPDLVPSGDGWLLVYSGGHCCTPPCTYSVGVARAPTPLGPYVKYAGNPVLRPGNGWKCPGHGTLVRPPGGGLAFLHHAYRDDDPLNVHRQALLDPVNVGSDGWPVFGLGGMPVGRQPAFDQLVLDDHFSGRRLRAGWEWPFDARPRPSVRHSVLTVHGTVSRAWVPKDFAAVVRVRSQGVAGVLLTDGRLIGVRTGRRGLVVLDGRRVRARTSRVSRARDVTVRIAVRGGSVVTVAVRAGDAWRQLGRAVSVPAGSAVDRVALGPGAFDQVRLRPLLAGEA